MPFIPFRNCWLSSAVNLSICLVTVFCTRKWSQWRPGHGGLPRSLTPQSSVCTQWVLHQYFLNGYVSEQDLCMCVWYWWKGTVVIWDRILEELQPLWKSAHYYCVIQKKIHIRTITGIFTWGVFTLLMIFSFKRKLSICSWNACHSFQVLHVFMFGT